MALTVQQRSVLSRTTALVVGVVLLVASIACFQGGERTRAEMAKRPGEATYRTRRRSLVLSVPYDCMFGCGLVGLTLLGYALIPPSMLDPLKHRCRLDEADVPSEDSSVERP